MGGLGFCFPAGKVFGQMPAGANSMLLSESFTPKIWMEAFRSSHATMPSADKAFWQSFSRQPATVVASSEGVARVLTLPAPGVEAFKWTVAQRLVPEINDRMADAIRNDRSVSGFATLSAQDPQILREAERSLSQLRLSGLTLGANRGVRLDDRRFWPLYEFAEAAGAPLYFPAAYTAVAGDAPYGALDRAGVLTGASADSGAHANQLIFGGVLDAFPKLNVILARMGDGAATRYGQLVGNQEHLVASGSRGPERSIEDYFKQNIYLTTSDVRSNETVAFLNQVIGKGRTLPIHGAVLADGRLIRLGDAPHEIRS
ncbi:MAG: amidohydrolase family protein [Janthinobacterium lividum]